MFQHHQIWSFSYHKVLVLFLKLSLVEARIFNKQIMCSKSFANGEVFIEFIKFIVEFEPVCPRPIKCVGCNRKSFHKQDDILILLFLVENYGFSFVFTDYHNVSTETNWFKFCHYYFPSPCFHKQTQTDWPQVEVAVSHVYKAECSLLLWPQFLFLIISL